MKLTPNRWKNFNVNNATKILENNLGKKTRIEKTFLGEMGKPKPHTSNIHICAQFKKKI